MRTLRARLMVTYLAVIVLSLGLFVWRVGALLEASRFAETERDQEGRAILIASAVEELLEQYREGKINVAVLRQDVLGLARELSQRVILFDAQGVVLVDSEHSESRSSSGAQPEVTAAFQGRVAREVRFDPDDQSDALFTAAPVRHDQDLIGAVLLELPMSAVREANQQAWLMLTAAALLAALATVLVSLWMAQTLARPLAQLTRAATRMADGDLKQRVAVSAPEELAQLARSFNFMAGRISRVMEDQRAFVANAAHELRTPLTTIRLRAEALHDAVGNDPKAARRFATDIESETERLSRLVEQLLVLSRIETGLVTEHRRVTALENIARRVVDELRPRAAEAGIALGVDLANLPRVKADPDQMHQVFINLIDNAIKFTPPGGRIQIEAQVVNRLPQVENTFSEDSRAARQWLVTSVRDTGVGVPAEDLARIFDRFYQSDQARARDALPDSGSAGLGLAIVKSIIEAHGGRVWADSEKEKGTRLAFALPVFSET